MPTKATARDRQRFPSAPRYRRRRSEASKQHLRAQWALTKILDLATELNCRHHNGRYYLRWPDTPAGRSARDQFISIVYTARNAEDLAYQQAIHKGDITEWKP